MDVDVGARLRSIREANGLSQRELARRAGVTNGTISLIEQNHSSPSVASLRKVLQGIPMSLQEFFSQEMPPPDRIVFRPEDLTEITHELQRKSKGAIAFRQVGDARQHSLQILYETYDPGADTGRTLLQHESEEGGIIISGRMELTVEDERHILGPGDAYLFDSRRPHRFRNPFDESCVLISACTPPYL
jgi:transcriptional regulator with XRE-family HTH domain